MLQPWLLFSQGGLLWPTAANVASSRIRISRLIAGLSTVVARGSVASSGAVICRRGAGLRPVAAAVSAVSSRIETARQPVEPVPRALQAGQVVPIPVNAALFRTPIDEPTAVPSTVTVAVSAALSKTVTFRRCVAQKPGVDQDNAASSRTGICRLRAGQRLGTEGSHRWHDGVVKVRGRRLQ